MSQFYRAQTNWILVALEEANKIWGFVLKAHKETATRVRNGQGQTTLPARPETGRSKIRNKHKSEIILVNVPEKKPEDFSPGKTNRAVRSQVIILKARSLTFDFIWIFIRILLRLYQHWFKWHLKGHVLTYICMRHLRSAWLSFASTILFS